MAETLGFPPPDQNATLIRAFAALVGVLLIAYVSALLRHFI